MVVVMMPLIDIDVMMLIIIIICSVAFNVEHIWIIPKTVHSIDKICCDHNQRIRIFLNSVIVINIIIAHCLVVIRGNVFKLCDIGMIVSGIRMCRVVCGILFLKLGGI